MLLNVVATAGTASGSITAYPGSGARPRTPNLYYPPRQTVANLVGVPVGIGGKVTFFNGSAGTVQLIANIHGYTLAGAAAQAGAYRAVAAARIVDSGVGTGIPRAAVKPNAAVTVQVTGRAGIPSTGLATVLLNVVAAGGSTNGSITTYPGGGARPRTPNVYYSARQTVANLVSVPVGIGGKVTFFNGSAGTVQLIANIYGYTIHDTTAPARVTNISVSSVTGTSVKLSWHNPVDADFAGVTVRSASGSTPPSSPTSGTAVAELTMPAAEVDVMGLVSGTQYTFAFFSHDFTANYSSAISISATTAATAEPPGPVTDAGTSVMTPASVSLTWKNPTEPSLAGVMIRRLAGATAPESPSEGSLVAEVPTNTTEYTDGGLAAGTEYSYALFAHNGTPELATAATVRATTSSGTPVSLERSVDVIVGSSIPIDVSDTFSRVASIHPRSGSPAGLTVQLTDTGVVTLAVTSTVDSGLASLVADGSGCVDKNCDIPFVVAINASVIALADATPANEDFTQPAPDRLARAETVDDVKALNDEVILTLGSPQNPGTLGEARSLAMGVGAVVSGGLEDLGVYELRWTTPPSDLDPILAELSSSPIVASATRSTFGSAEINATPPGDWNDDGQAVKWPFQQIHAQEAWDITTGGNVKVGIVDGGTVYRDHEDLNVTQTLGSTEIAEHATHVAGLACAVANGRGLVGTAWGCPVVSSGLAPGDIKAQLGKNALQAARQTAKTEPRVINMSLGKNEHDPDFCVTKARSDAINAEMQAGAAPSRQLFNGPIGRDIVWTLSAGNNCGVGVHSPFGASWALPNVITVAASNSDSTLASFSNFGPGVEWPRREV
ncbi:fibronectin type III domain-containing protein [Kribbella sp. NPDC051587]|uniref:fibronectin type III domain-containing protein n=1 Tax=Kribbella sp. NPDC051587 TaxID=3364119 RepID=UPI0037926E38